MFAVEIMIYNWSDKLTPRSKQRELFLHTEIDSAASHLESILASDLFGVIYRLEPYRHRLEQPKPQV
jgi:hypothetical protein